jgi:hypothetical protein
VNRNLVGAQRNGFRSASFGQLKRLATEGTHVQRYPALKIGQCKSTLTIPAVCRSD